ncbi:beta-lactamase/transpeptidase-like protein [Dacryopinax primogenitus]|uniref:Beta-lactamase/transpeptidase-like protein n=1 Tax=Dacryopinax primogenitus (strain DJM 731) TaxID=1858805 RepID=M5G7R5_DACPD|nr:beta-lactamase/transpeptidase-like protein [Dacryopinax primogenitus]EJU06241.1 beta-lactamase/transpeptidase-like protein [Dacryopinax primogenitus]
MPLTATLDALILSSTSKPNGIPGLSLNIVRSSQSLYTGAFGLRDPTWPDDPWTEDTVVWMASMTKVVTAVAVLIAVERGLVGLDDDLCQTVPGLTNLINDRSQPCSSGDTPTAPKPITLRHLLTHSTGLVYSAHYPHAQAIERQPKVVGDTRGALGPFWFEPSEEWHYGMGVDCAAVALEELTGQNLGDFMAEHLFLPLGMDSTSFDLTPSMIQRKASPYTRLPNGNVVPNASEYWRFEVTQSSGGGGLWSTAKDYGRFFQMILRGGTAEDGTRIIGQETLRMGMRGQLKEREKESINKMHRKDHSLLGMVFDEDLPTGRSKGTVQWDGSSSCYWWIDREKDVALALCTQITPSDDPEVQKLLKEVDVELYKSL